MSNKWQPTLYFAMTSLMKPYLRFMMWSSWLPRLSDRASTPWTSWIPANINGSEYVHSQDLMLGHLKVCIRLSYSDHFSDHLTSIYQLRLVWDMLKMVWIYIRTVHLILNSQYMNNQFSNWLISISTDQLLNSAHIKCANLIINPLMSTIAISTDCGPRSTKSPLNT